jgi:hypothetical protein
MIKTQHNNLQLSFGSTVTNFTCHNEILYLHKQILYFGYSVKILCFNMDANTWHSDILQN